MGGGTLRAMLARIFYLTYARAARSQHAFTHPSILVASKAGADLLSPVRARTPGDYGPGNGEPLGTLWNP